VLVAIFFRGDLIMTTIMEMANRRGWRKYLAELWIMKLEEIGRTRTMDSFKRKADEQMVSNGVNSWNTLGYRVKSERLNTGSWCCQKRNLE
jgi:hypothetical protein